jgi:hypothetical protein
VPQPTNHSDADEVRRLVRESTPFWAEKFGKIVDKNAQLVPFVYKPGQLAFDAELERQRAAGKPMRIIVLKARKVGISTATQAKLIHRCIFREHYEAVVVAQDKGTGEKLYNIGERLYVKQPDDPELKPKLGRHRRSQYLHFVGDGSWQHGEAFPDSSYFVDTANEYEAGRGATPAAIHASEVAFWKAAMTKLTALKNSMPKVPETLFVIESTANGFNDFKDIWDDAEEGRSNYAAFFWPWWKEAEYRVEFLTEGERERFVIGDPNHPYAEEEPDLVEKHGLDIEQLAWRREVIADECNGDVRTFHQEYPSTPEEAFVATGSKVFDSYRTAQLLVRVDLTDPRTTDHEHPGPKLGDFAPNGSREDPTMNGTIEVPTGSLFVPRERGIQNTEAPWRLWLEEDEMGQLLRPSEYVMGVDVSGGKTETTDETDYHAIQVIDHKTREQVAEYRSRIEPRLLVLQILLGALFFNDALVAIERTGSWGVAPLQVLWHDYHYPHLFRAKKTGAVSQRTEDRLGWDTNVKTKPMLIAGAQELLRINEDGIKSRLLAGEIRTYTRTEKGTTEAEPGKFDDLLMAWMIAQEVAKGQPLRGGMGAGGFTADGAAGQLQEGGFVAGLASYDPRC